MTQQTSAEDKEVLQALEGVYKAWGENDADAFVENYTEDARVILPGSHLQGKDGVRKTMAAGFAGPLKGSSTVDKVLDIRFLDSTSAVVISESGILMAGETTVPDPRMVMATWVLTKRDGRWLITSYHNCQRDAPGR